MLTFSVREISGEDDVGVPGRFWVWGLAVLLLGLLFVLQMFSMVFTSWVFGVLNRLVVFLNVFTGFFVS